MYCTVRWEDIPCIYIYIYVLVIFVYNETICIRKEIATLRILNENVLIKH